MQVLITGAGGTLGRSLIPRLAGAGHTVRALDVRPGDSDGAAEWIVGDVRDAGVVRAAFGGVDVVVHGAALHGIHLGKHSPRDFYELNVTGTFNVWDAAVQHDARGVVFSSTMGVYGDSRRPVGDADVVFLDENVPLRPADVYGWTKVVGEELCQYHYREHGIPSIALRFGMFVPEPFFRYGIRLLYGGLHEDDAAAAVMASIAALDAGEVTHAAFNVESPLPFTTDDAPDLRRAPLEALERHWPGSRDLLRSRGVRSLTAVNEVFPVSRLSDTLSYRPSHDFSEWLTELASRPDEGTDRDPPWP